MTNKQLIIGSRSSKLAFTQAELVKNNLQKAYSGLDIQIKAIKTTGDRILHVPLSRIGDKGLFTKEIEEALLNREIDIAVHSMKDLPNSIPNGLRIAAITKREDPCDILVSEQGFKLKTLPKNSKVGTSSLRRRAQLLNKRSDLEIVDLRGNLDTRIRKLEQGLFDAIILAYAGIKRLGLKLNLLTISTDEILPQAGQGALGVQVREDDLSVANIVKTLDEIDSRICIEAERALLAALGGGCQVPIGVYAKIEAEQVIIKAGVFSLDGTTAIKDDIRGEKKNAHLLGRKLAEKLVKKGAKYILDTILN
jgi:hydroxymethylbilane synthase